jgi:hypothetical protein
MACRALHIANHLNSSSTYPLLELFFKNQVCCIFSLTLAFSSSFSSIIAAHMLVYQLTMQIRPFEEKKYGVPMQVMESICVTKIAGFSFFSFCYPRVWRFILFYNMSYLFSPNYD